MIVHSLFINFNNGVWNYEQVLNISLIYRDNKSSQTYVIVFDNVHAERILIYLNVYWCNIQKTDQVARYSNIFFNNKGI